MTDLIFNQDFIRGLIIDQYPAAKNAKAINLTPVFMYFRPNVIGDVLTYDINTLYYGFISVESANLWEFKLLNTDANKLLVVNQYPVFRNLYAKSTLKSLYFTGFKINVIL